MRRAVVTIGMMVCAGAGLAALLWAVTVGGMFFAVLAAITSAAFFSVAALVAPTLRFLALCVMIASVPIVVMVPTVGGIVTYGAAVVFFLLAVHAMRRDMRLCRLIHVARHAGAGATRLTLAGAVIVAMVVYHTLVTAQRAPAMLQQSLKTVVTGPIVRMVLPVDEMMRVDDFIAATIAQQAAAPSSVRFLEDYAALVSSRIRATALRLPSAPAAAPSAMVTAARADLSAQLGVPLRGDESVADVFVAALSRQMENIATQRLPVGYTFSAALAAVIALFVFVTVAWLGTFLAIVWTQLARGIFALLRRIGAIHIIVRSVPHEEVAP